MQTERGTAVGQGLRRTDCARLPACRTTMPGTKPRRRRSKNFPARPKGIRAGLGDGASPADEGHARGGRVRTAANPIESGRTAAKSTPERPEPQPNPGNRPRCRGLEHDTGRNPHGEDAISASSGLQGRQASQPANEAARDGRPAGTCGFHPFTYWIAGRTPSLPGAAGPSPRTDRK